MEAKDLIKFASVAVEACKGKKRDVVIEFECPLCHSTAAAVRSGYNGHHRASCSVCKAGFIQ